jgi:hypothetical protein
MGKYGQNQDDTPSSVSMSKASQGGATIAQKEDVVKDMLANKGFSDNQTRKIDPNKNVPVHSGMHDPNMGSPTSIGTDTRPVKQAGGASAKKTPQA